MKEGKLIIVFEDQPVRRVWDKKAEKWFFSVIDIIAVLTEQRDFKKAQSYWTTLKNRLKIEGSEIVTKCDKLKLMAKDGKKYLTDVLGLGCQIKYAKNKKVRPQRTFVDCFCFIQVSRQK